MSLQAISAMFVQHLLSLWKCFAKEKLPFKNIITAKTVAPTADFDVLQRFLILHSVQGYTVPGWANVELTCSSLFTTTPKYSWAKDWEIKLPIFLLALNYMDSLFHSQILSTGK
jgi:hypothetical protein